MPDYEFGNRLFRLRTEQGLSQAALSKMLNVTDKAVSKWENGRAKPTVDALRRLSQIFGVPVEALLEVRAAENPVRISRIVVTGGPCAGKTTAMSWIQNAFSRMGYSVLFVPETATELISGGVAPWTLRDNADFQTCLMGLQRDKERAFSAAAARTKGDRALIVCDRGALDNRAYMSVADFRRVMNALETNEVELRDGYDAVFHLVTAAKGAAEFYTLANNAARTETIEQAAALDDKLVAAWTGHPHLRIIDNSTNFEEKMLRLIAEISAFLGEPEPFEIERKYLIQYPDLKLLERLPNCRRIDIIQTYLVSLDPGEELRIRQRGMDGNYTYYLTRKRTVTGLKRVETERRLSKDEYLALMMNADPAYRQIRKTRYCLAHGSQYFEIDIYPFWTDRAILEVELRDEGEAVAFPDFLEVIREVTEDDAYRNHSLARI